VHCGKDMRGISDETARNHNQFCAKESPGQWIPGLKAYEVNYFLGRDRFRELFRAKKLFKKNNKWYRRTGDFK
jgi:hypothetical protein